MRVVDSFVRVFVAKCIYITKVVHGGESVPRGVLVDVAVPWYKDNYQPFSGFHRASLLSVTFINQLMHSIIIVVDVKNLCYTKV